MSRKEIAIAATVLLIFWGGVGVCEFAALTSSSSVKTADGTSQSQTAKKPAEEKSAEQPADLTGTWKQTNSDGPAYWLEAEITDNTITVYWIGANGDSKALYWKGSYDKPDKAGDWKWTSQGDTAAMQGSMTSSTDATMDFTYTKADGVSWEQDSPMGDTMVVKTAKQ